MSTRCWSARRRSSSERGTRRQMCTASAAFHHVVWRFCTPSSRLAPAHRSRVRVSWDPVERSPPASFGFTPPASPALDMRDAVRSASYSHRSVATARRVTVAGAGIAGTDRLRGGYEAAPAGRVRLRAESAPARDAFSAFAVLSDEEIWERYRLGRPPPRRAPSPHPGRRRPRTGAGCPPWSPRGRMTRVRAARPRRPKSPSKPASARPAAV